MKLSRLKLKVQKHSPEILMSIGVASILGGVVTACKATLNVNDILEKHRDRRDELKAIPETVNPVEDVEYSEKAQKADLVKLYLHTGLDFAKNYALPAGLTILGITSLLASNRILKTRYVGAVAAYNSVSEAFKRYRKNVIATEGAEKDREYLYGKGEKKTIEALTVNDEGQEVYSKQASIVVDGEVIDLSEYAVLFANGTTFQWDPNEYYNRTFINGVKKFYTNVLRDRGHVFLNEVFDHLGLEMTTAGSVIGWVYNPTEGLDCTDEIEFDIHEVWIPNEDSNGKEIHEPAYYIDFPNLSGIIFDKLS